MRNYHLMLNKAAFFVAIFTLTVTFLLTSCSSKNINLMDVGSVVVDYAALKDEFKETKINWNKNSKNYNIETQKAVNTGIASIQIFYDTASGISRKRKILNIQDVYYDALIAVKNIKNAIVADPGSSPQAKKKAQDVYEKTVDMNSNINLLYDKLLGVKDNEKYSEILRLVISALKLTR